MNSSFHVPAVLLFAGLFFFAVALSTYARVVSHLRRLGGKVRAEIFTISELLMSIVLGSFFIFVLVDTLRRHAEKAGAIRIESVLPNAVLFILLSAGVAVVMRYRGVRLSHAFGFDQMPAIKALGWSAVLLFSALPLTAAANALALLALKNQFAPQPLVQLFSEVARQGNTRDLAKIFAVGVFVQPVCEEFLFRGFFYGVGKRYFGALPSGIVCSVFFAIFHADLSALAGLLTLAVCLNLAYERTGTLLVPIGMHALFNATTLVVLFIQAQHFLPT